MQQKIRIALSIQAYTPEKCRFLKILGRHMNKTSRLLAVLLSRFGSHGSSYPRMSPPLTAWRSPGKMDTS